MAGLYFDQFSTGQVFEHATTRTVTETDNLLATVMSMNPQPLHLDIEFAAQTEFKRPLVNSLFTLALVIGGSAMASELHVSAPIAMVVAGLIIGNLGRNKAMNEMTRRYLDGFWELLDDMLNALLFALIGMELLLLPFSWLHLLAASALAVAILLSRLLNLNDTQAGVLQLVFKIADDNGLLLLDLKDLRAMVQHVGEHAKEFTTEYGNVSAASIGAIQRSLLTLGEQGGEAFFGEPMLDINDLMQTEDGKGIVNILAADKLMASPRLYSTFLLWLLSELFEQLPEVGDVEKPKLVFFFDEAHLLFNEAPPALQEKIEQVVRLIRSKGVGVYFVTQNPLDSPDPVLGQLGNRVQHALRAFTPRDQKAVKTAAETLRANPAFDAAAPISSMLAAATLAMVAISSSRAKRPEGIECWSFLFRAREVSASPHREICG